MPTIRDCPWKHKTARLTPKPMLFLVAITNRSSLWKWEDQNNSALFVCM